MSQPSRLTPTHKEINSRRSHFPSGTTRCWRQRGNRENNSMHNRRARIGMPRDNGREDGNETRVEHPPVRRETGKRGRANLGDPPNREGGSIKIQGGDGNHPEILRSPPPATPRLLPVNAKVRRKCHHFRFPVAPRWVEKAGV